MCCHDRNSISTEQCTCEYLVLHVNDDQQGHSSVPLLAAARRLSSLTLATTSNVCCSRLRDFYHFICSLR